MSFLKTILKKTTLNTARDRRLVSWIHEACLSEVHFKTCCRSISPCQDQYSFHFLIKTHRPICRSIWVWINSERMHDACVFDKTRTRGAICCSATDVARNRLFSVFICSLLRLDLGKDCHLTQRDQWSYSLFWQ